MERLVVEGGVRLAGRVRVGGARNAALPLLAAALLTDGPCVLENVPRLGDVAAMQRALRGLGVAITSRGAAAAAAEAGGATVRVQARSLTAHEIPYERVRALHASVLVLGPLLARHGVARVALPGGSALGARPIDRHLAGLEALGARVRLDRGYVDARARRLRGARIVLDAPTVTGTESLLMAATLARGHTTIENAAREPEVEELARVLNKMGARTRGAGTSIIEVEGVERLEPLAHAVMPDRIEAGVFLVAGVMAGGDVLVEGGVPEHIEAVTARLRAAGATVSAEAGGVRVRAREAPCAVDITTRPHPGVPSDLHGAFLALATRARGQSVLTETIFTGRHEHAAELRRLGADVSIDGRTAVVRGVGRLRGAPVTATDSRASAALVLAGLVAEGRTEVWRADRLDRAFEGIERKLAGLGARIRRERGTAA